MKKSLVFLILVLSLSTLAFPGSSKGPRKTQRKGYYKKADKSDQLQFLDVSQVKRGMKGYGLSVFSGYKPTRFNVEIIGILKNDGPKSDLILAKFSGGPLEKTGVIAGMSGSPVYIDGKLVGAVSHAFPWSKEPIGAIRPIKEMLKVLKKRKYKPSNEPLRFIPLEAGVRKSLEKLDPNYFKNTHVSERVALVGKRRMTLVPIKTPILFSGIDDRILDIMRPEMEAYGFYPIKNGSGGRIDAPKGVSRTLNPGDAVGIPLISGDMHATPVGTVTYRKGNEILIFGHPSFFRGPIDMPMSKEYIHTVIPSREVSFKLSSTLFEVGRVFDDRNTAVAGELGTFSKTIPVQVTIKNEGRNDKFHFRIVKDNMFFPNLLISSIMQSVFNVNSRASYSSIKFKFQIKVKNLETGHVDTITTHDFLTGNETQKNMFQGLFRLTLPLQSLLYNPFVKTEILEVKAHLDLTQGWKASELVKIKVLKNYIRPGDTVPILVTLRNYKGKRFYQKVEIKLPQVIKSNIIALGVGSAKVEMTLDRAFSLARFIPKNYNHLIKILNRNERFNDMVVWVDIPEKGLVVDGREHPNLPSSVMSIMQSGNSSMNGTINGRVKKYYRSNYLIYGIQVVPLVIHNKDLGQ